MATGKLVLSPQTTLQPPAALATEVDHLRDRENTEITFLREQLEQRSWELAAERERFDVIQQLALQRIEALTMGTGDQRQGSPERAAESPGRDGSAREGGIPLPRGGRASGGRRSVVARGGAAWRPSLRGA